MRLQGTLCGCVQWVRRLPSPYWLWESNQLPQRYRHLRRWWCSGGWLSWQPLSRGCVQPQRRSHLRVWVSLCQGNLLFWTYSNYKVTVTPYHHSQKIVWSFPNYLSQSNSIIGFCGSICLSITRLKMVSVNFF